MARLNIDRGTYNRWPSVITKRKVKNVPVVGFEWEVPYNMGEEPQGDFYDWYEWGDSVQVADDIGFRNHSECGCLELASPTATNIATTRKLATTIINRVRTKSFLGDYEGDDNEGGIHVSVSDPDGTYDYEAAQRLLWMLHRKGSADWLWDFSQRENTEYYEYRAQGECYGWKGDYPSNDDVLEMEGYETIRFQNERLEFRIWWNHEKILIPAIEFAHSSYIFSKKRKRAKAIPYLSEYRDWLFKQPGYKTLKKHCNWSLIND